MASWREEGDNCSRDFRLIRGMTKKEKKKFHDESSDRVGHRKYKLTKLRVNGLHTSQIPKYIRHTRATETAIVFAETSVHGCRNARVPADTVFARSY